MTSPSAPVEDGLRLRPAGDRDWPVIRRWLGQPEIIRWWGPKATTEAEVLLAMATSQAICRIIEVDAVPVGYAHAIDAGFLGEPAIPDIPIGAWSIDLFVASPAHRGRGVGARALELIRDEVFGTTLAPAVSVLVAVGNEKAVRAYENAGFRWRAVTVDALKGPEWLMLAERPAR